MKCLPICSSLILCFSGMFSSYRPGIFFEFILKYFIFLMLLETETSTIFIIIHQFHDSVYRKYWFLFANFISCHFTHTLCLGVLMLLTLLAFQHTRSRYLHTHSFSSPFPPSHASHYFLLIQCGN